MPYFRFLFYNNIRMEESKKKEIKSFLEAEVNPVLKPMVEEIARQRPNNVYKFINQYTTKQIAKSEQRAHPDSESEEEEEEVDHEYLQQLEAKKKKKMEKKISRQGISAEVFGQFNKKDEFIPKVIEKSPKTEAFLKQLIDKSILFQALNNQEKLVVVKAMEEKVLKPGDEVIGEGDQGDTLYIVGEGEYSCTKVINGTETYLKSYTAGEYFGELALMYNAPRAATIRAKSEGKIYGIDRSTFNNLVQAAVIKKRNYYSEVISKVEILAETSPSEKDQLCDAMKETEYQQGSYVVRQGDEGKQFYIVAVGKLSAEKVQGSQAKKVFEYKQGDYFGEIALVKNTTRQASIKCDSHCRIISIDRDAFKRLLGPMEDILQRNMEKYKKYMSS